MLKSRGFVDLYLIGILVSILMVFAFLGFASNSLAKIRCRDSASVMGLEYKYGQTIGCMVKVDGRYYPLGAIRYANGKVQVEASE